MKQITLVAICTLFLFACTTPQPMPTVENYQAKLDTWIGASENALISKWGIPQQTYTNGNTKLLQYNYSDSLTMPSSYSTSYDPYTNTATTYQNGGYNLNYWCETTFTITNGIVESWRIKGNRCVSH